MFIPASHAALPVCPRPCLACCSACQVRDAGNLLTRAGLSIPAVDVDEIQVHYRDAVQLVEHLRWAT
jgi:hypothetical protein